MRRLRRGAPTSPLVACLAATVAWMPSAPAADTDKITFDDHIFSIFESHCLECHNPDEAKGGLDLSTYGATMTGGSGGEILNPGRPDESKIYLVTAKIEEEYMPPKGEGLSKAELESLKNWIARGVLENTKSTPKKAKETKVTMKVDPATLGKPDGPPPMPEHLLLEPVVVTERAAATSAVAVSPWAPLAAIAGQKQVLLYRTDNNRLVGVLPFPEGHVESLQFSRSGSLLLAGGGAPGKNGRIVGFDVKTGARKLELGREFDTILASDISADHAHVAFGGPSRLIKILLTSTGEEVASIKKHTDWVTAVRYSPDGILVATGDRQGNLYVWEGQSGNLFHDLRGHGKAITSLEWRADSNVLASSSEDGQVILWEMREGKQVKRWAAHGTGALDLDFHRDATIATVGRDRRAKLWDQAGKSLGQSGDLSGEPLVIRFTNDGKKLIIGDWTGAISTWQRDLKTAAGHLPANPPSLPARIAGSANHIKTIEKQITDTTTAAAKAAKESEDAAVARNNLAKQLNSKRNEAKKLDDQLQSAKTANTPPPAKLPAQLAAAKKAVTDLEARLANADKSLPSKKKTAEDLKKKAAALAGQLAAAMDAQRYWQAAGANLEHHRLAESLPPLEEAARAEEKKFNQASQAHAKTAADAKSARDSLSAASALVETRTKDLNTAKESLPRQELDIRMTRLVLSQQAHAESLLREQAENSESRSPGIEDKFNEALAKASAAVASSEKMLKDQVHHFQSCVATAEQALKESKQAVAAAGKKLEMLAGRAKESASSLAAAKLSRDKASAVLAARKGELEELKKRYLALLK